MKYRPEIDGLRAVAVIPVILFHVGFKTFSGGYTGVDVFFVISGFLITTIIYSELEQNNFSIINFYERRARRILPLLFFILLVTMPLAWISLFQVDMIDYFESLISTSLFYSNILFAFEANYFDTSVELKPLLHTWSLAVEEQYYIIFPVLMILLWKFNQKNRLLTLLIFFGILSFAFSEWASHYYPKYNFYLLPSRAWELAIGAILAIANKKSMLTKFQENNRVSEILSILGFILILLGYFIIKGDTRFPSAYALLPTVGSALVIGFANSKNFIGRLLSLRVFVFIGLISYSAYLWHHPIFAFSRHLSLFEDEFLYKVILSASIIPLSYLSWKYVENPFRNKKLFSRKFIFTFSIVGSLFFIISGIVGIINNGFPNRQIEKRLEYLSYNPDNRQLKSESWKYIRKANKEFKKRSWYDKSNALPNLLLVGNSHSKDLYNSFLSSKQFQDNFEAARYHGEITDLAQSNNAFYKSKNYQEAEIIIVASHYYPDDIRHLEQLANNFLLDNKIVVLIKEPYKFKLINSRTLADIAIQNYLREQNHNRDPRKDSLLVRQVNKEAYHNRIIDLDLEKIQSDSIIDQICKNHQQVINLDRNDYISIHEEEISFLLDFKFQKFLFDARHTTLEGAVFFGKRMDETQWLSPVINHFEKNKN